MHYFAPMPLSHCSVKRRLNVETSNTNRYRRPIFAKTTKGLPYEMETRARASGGRCYLWR
jgi:hypothetical protein